MEVPKAGAVRSAFERAFDIEFYKERVVGPCGYNSTTVQMIAKKRWPPAESAEEMDQIDFASPAKLAGREVLLVHG